MQPRTIATIAAASLFAAFAAQAQKGAVYQAPPVEPEYARFTLIGGATYLIPSMNGLDYVNGVTGLTTLPSTVTETPLQIDRGYGWGYYLAAGYMISDRYDVQVSWTQFNTENDDSATLCDPDAPLDITTCGFITSSGAFFSAESADVTSNETLNTQSFDATLGQYHQLGENLMTRVFAGVRYAKISNDTLNTYFTDGFINTESYDSNFWGIGPELGFDVNYDVYEWFGIVGHFAGAFLIGDLDSNTNIAQPFVPNPTVLIDSDAQTRIVPAFDAKLGLSLGVPFMDMQDRFILEVGYQVAYYFNAVDQIQTTSSFARDTALVTEAVHNYADVGIMGPYANLGLRF